MKKLKRRGLTLLELVVVMTILIAMAGMLVPLLPGMLGKAHTSTCSTIIGDLTKAMETHNLVERGYPDGYDSLMDDDGLYDLLPGYNSTGPTACGGWVVTTDLDGEGQERLIEAGITTLYGMDGTTDNATIEPYKAANDITLDGEATDPVTVAGLSQEAALELFNDNTADKYVVFGVGARSTIIGRSGIANAPIHFHEGEATLQTKYSRYGVIFDVTADPAEFVGAIALGGKRLGTIDRNVSGYYGHHDH